MFENFLNLDKETEQPEQTELLKAEELKIDKEKQEEKERQRVKEIADKFYEKNKNNLALAVTYLFNGKTKFLLEENLRKAEIIEIKDKESI